MAEEEKEFLSEWFIEGLKEIGLTATDYREMCMREKNDTKRYLADCGHF